MHSSAFGAAARTALRMFSSALRLSSVNPARYSSIVSIFASLLMKHAPRPSHDADCSHDACLKGASGQLGPQLTAFFTSALIVASSAAVNSFSAKDVGHMAPSSRFAVSLKPIVAYLVL